MVRQDILNEVKQAFGFIPDYFSEAPDAILEQWWTLLGWVLNDSAISGRDKALIAFGVGTAIHCKYCIPFHTAQLEMEGMSGEQIKEASWAVQSVTGLSSYLYGVDYDIDKFLGELAQSVNHIKKSSSA